MADDDWIMDRDDDEPRRKVTYFDAVFTLIVVLASSFSAYTTYKGFSYDIPPFLAVVLAVIIGLGLVAINFKIRDAKINRHSLAGSLTAFAFVFVFSFVSNSNAIYTYFLQGDIVRETQEVAWEVFDRETSNLKDALLADEAVAAFEADRKRLQVARRNLSRQLVDERNPGRGVIAREHLIEVERILGSKVTDLSPPSATAVIAEHRRYADQLDALIEEQAKTVFAHHPAQAFRGLLNRIDKLRQLYGSQIRKRQYDSQTTALMKQDLQTLGVETENLLNEDLEIELINDTADEIGSFRYTWRNFFNWISPAAIVLSVLLGALLDVLAPMLSLTLYRYEE